MSERISGLVHRAAYDQVTSERDAARAEVERLRGEAKSLENIIASLERRMDGPTGMRATNERLRAYIALLLPKADAFWRAGEVRPAWMREAREALGEVET